MCVFLLGKLWVCASESVDTDSLTSNYIVLVAAAVSGETFKGEREHKVVRKTKTFTLLHSIKILPTQRWRRQRDVSSNEVSWKEEPRSCHGFNFLDGDEGQARLLPLSASGAECGVWQVPSGLVLCHPPSLAQGDSGSGRSMLSLPCGWIFEKRSSSSGHSRSGGW